MWFSESQTVESSQFFLMIVIGFFTFLWSWLNFLGWIRSHLLILMNTWSWIWSYLLNVIEKFDVEFCAISLSIGDALSFHSRIPLVARSLLRSSSLAESLEQANKNYNNQPRELRELESWRPREPRGQGNKGTTGTKILF